MTAGYEGLTATQETELTRLMSAKMSTWPQSLTRWVQQNGPITCGDMLADFVGRWVKTHIG